MGIYFISHSGAVRIFHNSRRELFHILRRQNISLKNKEKDNQKAEPSLFSVASEFGYCTKIFVHTNALPVPGRENEKHPKQKLSVKDITPNGDFLFLFREKCEKLGLLDGDDAGKFVEEHFLRELVVVLVGE